MTAYFVDRGWNDSGKKEKRRVVVTGIGAVTPLGNNIDETWDSLSKGRSGIGPIMRFDASRYPVKIGAEVKNFQFDSTVPEDILPFLGRSTRFCLQAVKEAMESARIGSESADPERTGISLGANEEYMGVSTMSQLFDTNSVRENLELNKASGINNHPFPHLVTSKPLGLLWPFRKNAGTTANILSLFYNIQGPVTTTSSACASSAYAIGKAMRMIQDGDVDTAITGGADAMINETTLAGFYRLRTLSKNNDDPEKSSRPFDLKRDGFVLAEGAGILILEELSHARKRKAPILGEIVGFGTSSNAYRITASPEDGQGVDICMNAALRDAGCSSEDVDYINAHGTSTYLNDKSETAGIKRVFQERAYEIPVSSNKSMLGHPVASAAAIELLISILTLNKDVIPPTINYEYPDPECDLDYVPNEPRKRKVDTILSNSFAFGGQNASILVKKFV